MILTFRSVFKFLKNYYAYWLLRGLNHMLLIIIHLYIILVSSGLSPSSNFTRYFILNSLHSDYC